MQESDTTKPCIKTRRLVCHVGGFDPMPAATFHARFDRELARSAACWSISCTVGPLQVIGDHAAWDVTMRGPGWETDVRHLLFGWDDVIVQELRRGPRDRLLQGLGAAASFIGHGALARYCVIAWRYALFFLYPFLVIGIAAGLAIGVAAVTIRLGLPALLAWPLVMALFWGLYRLAGHRLYLDHLIDDWIFARRMVKGVPEPVAGRTLDMAALIQREAEDREVLVVGHSLGAVIAADIVARLADNDDRPLRFVTIGSSILKIGLHARAQALKVVLGRIAANPRIVLADIQALNDPMNFYKSKPLTALGIPGREMITRQVRFSRMLEPQAYARIRRNLFRLHCQFISGNTRRAAYDYAIMLAGPFPLEAWATRPTGPMELIGPDGAVTEEGRAVLAASPGVET